LADTGIEASLKASESTVTQGVFFRHDTLLRQKQPIPAISRKETHGQHHKSQRSPALTLIDTFLKYFKEHR